MKREFVAGLPAGQKVVRSSNGKNAFAKLQMLSVRFQESETKEEQENKVLIRTLEACALCLDSGREDLSFLSRSDMFRLWGVSARLVIQIDTKVMCKSCKPNPSLLSSAFKCFPVCQSFAEKVYSAS